jgi:type I restriction enzyme, S subunit
MPQKLPKGWVKTNLGEVCLPVASIQPEDSPDTEFTYFDIGGIDNERNRIAETKTVTGRNAPSRARQALRKNDILFSTVRTYLRKIARVEREYPNPIGSTGFAVIRAAEGVSSQLLFFQVLSEDFLQPLHALQSGSSYPAVHARDVFAQQILLPPTREQERIVTKLNAAFSAVQRAETAAIRALDRLQRYRAGVLGSAVTGALTSDWRNAQPKDKKPPIQTGEALLQSLLAARINSWQEAELKRLRAVGKGPKDDKWKSRYRPPVEPRIDDPPELPKGWSWASVDQLAAHENRSITDGPFGSNLKTSHYTNSGPRVVRLQNIGDGVFIDEKAHISRQHYQTLKEYAVYAGDLVIRALGTPAPRACKIPDSLGPAIVKADCIRFKVASEFISPDYVLWALNSPPVQERTGRMIHGIGRPRLKLGEIKSIALPLPPFEEQSAIVREVERRLTAADRLAATLKQQLIRAGVTRQSLLREAFAGRLVPQDPNDEPASLLLERIHAVREAEAQKPKGRPMSKSRAKMKAAGRKDLFSILKENDGPMTPEQLFHATGFKPSQVDQFYRELTLLRDKVREQRPKGSDAKSWPLRAHVFLQLKRGAEK